MTGGRTRTDRRDLRVETVLQALTDQPPDGLPSEQQEILRLCGEPLSVAEVAAKLGLVLGVVQVVAGDLIAQGLVRSEEHTSELQSLMRISYAVFCLKKKKINKNIAILMHITT